MIHQTTTTTLKTTVMTFNKNIALILTAAGSSTRMGLDCKKEYLPLEEGTILSAALKPFLQIFTPQILIVTVPQDDNGQALKALEADTFIKETIKSINIHFVQGGNTRQSSVYNALEYINSSNLNPEVVLIHDGARPYVSPGVIEETIKNTISYGAAVPGLMPVETQKIIDTDNFITTHLERKYMTAVQTPQGFNFEPLLLAHKKALSDKKEYTDDTEIWGTYVGKVKVVKGNPENIKITYSKDYSKEEKIMNINTIRTGLGYDLHRLVPGRKLILGGVIFDFDKGEDGHSDGDVLLHAITDALLGASGMGDIGSYFPPEEPKWKDANSVELLQTVWDDIKKAGWSLINLDCVIKLEKPKFLSHRSEVINSIAKALDEPAEKIFVKAKTGEKLDSVGKGDAVEVWSTCLLSK